MPPIDRRHALAAGLAGLLAACGNGRGGAFAGPRSTTTSTASTAPTAPTAPPAPTPTSPAALAGRFEAANSCSLTPETIAGPSFLEVDAIRSDLREDRPGTPLWLGLRILDTACAPLPDAAVELWNCDAQGLYSGYDQPSGDTTGQTWCRGTQVTDANGIATFLTVYPGWYRTRTAHLHARVLLTGTAVLTTQLYFDDAVTAEVYAAEPYASHPGQDTFNDGDSMFEPATVLTLAPQDEGWLGLLTMTVR